MSKRTMTISLTPELETSIQSLVERGMYGSQSEVVRAGLRLLLDQEAEREARLSALRSDLKIGLDQIERGEVVRLTKEEVLAEAREAYRKSNGQS